MAPTLRRRGWLFVIATSARAVTGAATVVDADAELLPGVGSVLVVVTIAVFRIVEPGTALSGGQQQRLCIARAIAVQPDVILMDEPCSALDPVATLKIEELMFELKENYTIVIVTHNMQQAARASDETIFLTMGDDRAGYLVERGPTSEIFTNPKNTLTEDYVSGRFG